MAVATALVIAGLALSAVSAIRGGIASKQQADFQAKQAEQKATQTRRKAAEDEKDARRDASRRRGASIARQGAGGGAIGTGTSLLTEEDFAAESERQFGRIQQQAEFDVVGLQNEASLLRSKGKSAQTAGFLRGGASVLTGAGSLFKPSTTFKNKSTVGGVTSVFT